MKPSEIKRLMELLGKSTRTEAENTELAALQAKAAALKEDATPPAGGAAATADEDGMTAEQVKALVTEAVNAAVKGVSTVTADQVKTIVADAMKAAPAFDTKSLTDAISAEVKKVVPAAGVSADDVKAIITGAMKLDRKETKMQFDTGADYELPIAHRSGNLTVAFKQLLNVMTKGRRYQGECPVEVMNDGIDAKILADAEKRGEAAEKRLYARLASKAITTTGSGTGAELMNFSLSSVLIQRMYLESKLAAAFVASEVQMPTNPFTYPLSTTRPVFRSGVAENNAPNASDPGTGSLVLNAKKLIGLVEYSYEADEDAIVAILPMVTQQLGASAGESLEDAIINGDTAGTHQDSDTAAVANHAAKLWNGIRKLALAQAALKVSFATGGVSAANIGALRKALGRWGLNPNDLLLAVGPNGYNDVVLLPETLTAEKAGNANTARILTGQAPNIFGIDIVPSAKIREDLNASGVYDGTTTTKGSMILIYKPAWIQGVRRGFTIETDKDVTKQKNFVVASFRRDFVPMESLANTRAAAISYNYNA